MKEGLLQPPTDMPESPADEDIDTSQFEGGEASAEEQSMYEEMMEVLLGMVRGTRVKDTIVNKLETEQDNLGRAVGELAHQLIVRVVTEVEKAGNTVPSAVLMEVGEELITELVELAAENGLVDDNDDEALGTIIDGAIDVTASKFGNEMRETGKTMPSQLQENASALDATFAKKPMAQAVQEGNGLMQRG